MSRAAFIHRDYRCLRCHGDYTDRLSHFRVAFWTASMFRGKPLTPSFRDLRCPDCGANPAWFESWPTVCSTFILPMREEYRPVVYRWIDPKDGSIKYRYPSTNDGEMRASEERIDFPTLRSMTTFLKEQNPNYRDWQVPLNDILDYDNPDTAISEFDEGAAQDASDISMIEDFGTITRDEAEALIAKDPSEARALIEKV